ncbi:MAG: 4-aminobutyrate--2-oxoglutarate transaminase [Candidatus Nanopelagicales bacterium]|nr:4-aminobutyrate--2-oxoglutarate transaminase [Candidatus Nanopelagicales bacterium]
MASRPHDSASTDIEQSRRLITPIPGPESLRMMARRERAVTSAVVAAHPVFIDRAAGGILVDLDGNHLIDLASGIAVTNVGNAAPQVVEAVAEQAAKITHTSFMITGYESYVDLCEDLNRITPGEFEKRSALFNSGAEAVENAVKVARSFTRRDAVVVFDNAYHGRTNLTMAMTAKSMPFKRGFGPFAPEVYRVPGSYPLRDGLEGEQAAARAIGLIESLVGADQVAAVVFEPILGEGGFIVPAPGFLPALAAWARAHGVLLIADEIQTGFCRTGDWFACAAEGVEPDLMALAKGIAGGLPVSAVTGRADVMDSVHTGGLGGTFGGSPVACAAGVAAIKMMSDLDLSGRARRIEVVCRPRLEALARESRSIVDVRGRGAMMAIELADRNSLEPLHSLTKRVVDACTAEGVVLLMAGTWGNVIRLLPPLVIDEDLLTEGLDVLSSVLLRLESGGEVPHVKVSAKRGPVPHAW